MGFISNLFGKKNNEEQERNDIFYAKQDEQLEQASKNAQLNFKYFWRELYWENHRIIPALNFAMVKIPFMQIVEGEAEPIVEHMWINNIDFDGENITGELVNQPNQLTNITLGDIVSKKVNEIGDWLFAMQGKVYGGYTIQVIRAGMGNKERKNHDEVWGLDFGENFEVLVASNQKENPENLIEHPMCKNMGESLRKFLNEHPEEVSAQDENGQTRLHRDAIAGNRTSIEILLEFNADKTIKSNSGKTAFDYALAMNWEHLIEVLR